MDNITKMLSMVFLCFILLSSTYGEDTWKEKIRQRLVRASEIYPLGWVKTLLRQPRAVTTTTTKSPTSFTQFQLDSLSQTNKYRATHCVPKLILNSTLNKIAQAYAVKLATLGYLVHSGNGLGENLYAIWSTVPFNPATFKGNS